QLVAPVCVRHLHGQASLAKAYRLGPRRHFRPANHRPDKHGSFVLWLLLQKIAHNVAQTAADRFHSFGFYIGNTHHGDAEKTGRKGPRIYYRRVKTFSWET